MSLTNLKHFTRQQPILKQSQLFSGKKNFNPWRSCIRKIVTLKTLYRYNKVHRQHIFSWCICWKLFTWWTTFHLQIFLISQHCGMDFRCVIFAAFWCSAFPSYVCHASLPRCFAGINSVGVSWTAKSILNTSLFHPLSRTFDLMNTYWYIQR